MDSGVDSISKSSTDRKGEVNKKKKKKTHKTTKIKFGIAKWGIIAIMNLLKQVFKGGGHS